MNDHYKTLGVTSTSTPAEIKSAFRKLAKVHHPDAGGDETKFQTINEAYEILKDPQKKAAYDAPPQTTNPFNYSTGFNSRHGEELNVNDILNSMFNQQQSQPLRGRDITIIANIKLKDVITGKKLSVAYSLLNGDKETVEADIPAGVHNGMKIRYINKGDVIVNQQQQNAYPRGDLYIQVAITNERNWERSNNDLITRLHISAIDMILGSDVIVNLLDGTKVKLNIPAGAKNNNIHSIAEHGVPDIKTKARGRLLIQVIAEIPTVTSSKAIKRLKEVQSIIKNNP